MIDLLEQHREPILTALAKLMDNAAAHLDHVTAWAEDFRRRLVDFACRGKLIRGALVAAAGEAFGYRPDSDVYRVAAAVELIQSFLLIHDDIMDEDAVRRGQPAVFEQYRRLGERSSYSGSSRFGESMGICSGDVAILLAFEAVVTTTFEPLLRTELLRRISVEIADVGVAQMADVANGHRAGQATEDEILSVYRYKTGRYTFSLPLALGATIAGAPASGIEALSRWGEFQGVIFQLRDDQLGIMEDETATGKPAGSDVQANKQTLHRLLLLGALPGTSWEHVGGYFGSPVSPEQVQEVRAAMRHLGVLDEIDVRVAELQASSDQVMQELPDSGGIASLLERIALFNRERRV